jgi:hypothetical protein
MHSAALEAFRAGGVLAAKALVRALARGGPLGPEYANGRAVMEDLESCLVEVGRAHPEVMLLGADRHPSLTTSFAFVAALATIPKAAAADRLVPLCEARQGAIRWLALRELIARKDPRATLRLGTFLRDRDGLVVFVAVTAMRRWGTASDLSALMTLARGPKTAIGTREAAFDAIESICARTGRRPPRGCPAPRLVDVTLPRGARVLVSCADLVAEERRIAERGNVAVLAPCEGVVVDIDDDVIVLRRARR